MSILVQVLLTLLVLSACLGDVVTPQPHTLRIRTLKETMNLLETVQQEQEVGLVSAFPTDGRNRLFHQAWRE